MIVFSVCSLFICTLMVRLSFWWTVPPVLRFVFLSLCKVSMNSQALLLLACCFWPVAFGLLLLACCFMPLALVYVLFELFCCLCLDYIPVLVSCQHFFLIIFIFLQYLLFITTFFDNCATIYKLWQSKNGRESIYICSHDQKIHQISQFFIFTTITASQLRRYRKLL